MATEHFCLRWNNHQSTLVSVFDNLLESGTLVDCTLAADGRYLKAHKVVLSACSTYLGMLLSQHHDKHPIIILKDVKFDELKAMLDYMYRGEVNISQEQLSTFLKAAESLQIKGLTDTGGEDGNGLLPTRPPSSSSTTSLPNDDPQSPRERGSPIPRKRKRYKHSDDPPETEVKVSISDEIDQVSLESGRTRTPTNTDSPSAIKNVSFSSGSVKREPTDGEGDGPMSVDDSSDSAMMARPGPSNGSSTNNRGSPWILSADSTGEEMQLTPGQDGGYRDKEKDALQIREETCDEALSVEKNYTRHSEEFSSVEEVVKSELNSPDDDGDVGFIQISGKEISYNNKINVKIYNGNREGELIIPDMIENSGKYDTPQINTKYLYTDKSKMVAVSSKDQNSPILNETNKKLNEQCLTFSNDIVTNSGDRYLQSKNFENFKKYIRIGSNDFLKLQDSFTKPSASISSFTKNVNSIEIPQENTLSHMSALNTKSSLLPSSITSQKSLDVSNINCKIQGLVKTKPSGLLSKFRKILPAPENNKRILPPHNTKLSNVPQSQPPQKYNSGIDSEKTPLTCNSQSSDSLIEPSLSFDPTKQPNPSDFTSFLTPAQPHLSSSNQSMQTMSNQIKPPFTNPQSQISIGCVAHELNSTQQSNSRLVQGNHLMIQPELSGPNPQTSTSNITSTLRQPQYSFNHPVNNESVSDINVQTFVHPTYQRISQSIENQNIVISQQPFAISPAVFVTSRGTTCTRESTTPLINPSILTQTQLSHQSSPFPQSGSTHLKCSEGQLNTHMMPRQTLSASPQNTPQQMQVLYMRPATSEDLNVVNKNKLAFVYREDK